MSDDRKRTYQTVTPLPTLRTTIAVPPLKMVLVDDLKNEETKLMEGPGEAGGQSPLNVPATKERIVRKLIKHLEKDS